MSEQNKDYTGTPLLRKLGIKSGFKMRFVHEPDYLIELLHNFPDNVDVVDQSGEDLDYIHYFAQNAADYERDIVSLKNELKQNGMIWVSWPKKSSGVITDVSDKLIRDKARSIGLIDTKVCSIDQTWSALKLMIPVKDRK
jgi:hypothetical protein